MERIELLVENPTNVKHLKKLLSEGYIIVGPVATIIEDKPIKGSFEGFEYGSYFLEKETN